MYKSILVHVDPEDPCSAARIQTAAHLSQDCHAQLIGAMAALPIAMLEIYAAGATALAAGIITGEPNELDERFAAGKAEFDKWTVDAGIQTQWRTATDFPTSGIVTMSGRADLLVVGTNRGRPANTYLDTADLIMRAGRPVLVIPQEVTKLDTGTAVVAWRNTRESRRALADALPLVATFGNVVLVHVKERGEDADASIEDAAAMLEDHGIAAQVKTIESGHDSAGYTIAHFATLAQAGLIVAGAYGHSRLREWALGGVTSDLVQELRIPRLFSR